MHARRPTSDPHVLALRWLARRELSESQVRERLLARGLDESEIAETLATLRAEGAVDDRRAARACARTNAILKRHGPQRVRRALAVMGISEEVTADVLDEVFPHEETQRLLDVALSRRLERVQPAADGDPDRTVDPLDDPGEYRRTQAYLVRLGFHASDVADAMRRRRRQGPEQSPS